MTQLNEAYNFMNKKMKQDYVAFFEKIMNARDAIILTGKANRKQRKPRARSKESIIKKTKVPSKRWSIRNSIYIAHRRRLRQ